GQVDVEALDVLGGRLSLPLAPAFATGVVPTVVVIIIAIDVVAVESGRGGPATEGGGDRSQGGGELGGDDPQFGGGTVGDLRQHLQVLVGEQFRIGVAAVNGVEDLQDRPRLTLGLEDRGLGLALGAQD